MRIAGVVWLGVTAIRNSSRSVSQDVEVFATPGWFAAFRTGMVTNLLNPKVGVF